MTERNQSGNQAEGFNSREDVLKRAYIDMCQPLGKFGPKEILDLLTVNSRRDAAELAFFWGGSLMADGYFLFLTLFLSNCDFLDITFPPAALPPNTHSPVAFACNGYLNLQKMLWFLHKKPGKKLDKALCLDRLNKESS